MTGIDKLPPNTRKLWERLRQEPLLKGFVLIGGTALTLRIAHRISEDLDFAYMGNLLPRKQLAALVRRLRDDGITMEINQDPAAQEEFIETGLELDDHQQNYLAQFPTGQMVKVSFARFENKLTNIIDGNAESPLRVATLDEVFRMKAIACGERSKTRDWFDLHTLMNRHGFNGLDFHRAFAEDNLGSGFSSACARLRSGKPSLTDEGYSSLIENPPSLDEMRGYFSAMLDALEVDLAEAAFRAQAK